MMRKRIYVACGVLAIGLGLVSGCGPNNAGGTTKDKPFTPPTSVSPSPAPPVTHGATIDGDGTFKVGSQIQPGTYKTVVPKDSFGCYWERLSDASGNFNSIITNGNGEPGSQQVVTISSTDKFFHTERCGDWKLTVP